MPFSSFLQFILASNLFTFYAISLLTFRMTQFHADNGGVDDHFSCFDIVTGGAGATRFWGLRGKNILCKYGASNGYKHVSTAMLCGMYKDGAPYVTVGDSEGSILSHLIFAFVFDYHLIFLFSLWSLTTYFLLYTDMNFIGFIFTINIF